MSTRKEINTYLIRGCESEEKINLLLSVTSIRSDNVIRMLKRYYVQGMSEESIKSIYGVSQSNLNRDRHKLEEVAAVFEKLYELKIRKVM